MAILLAVTPLAFPPVVSGADDWFEKGVAALKAHRYDEAIEAFTLTIEVIPHDYQAYGKRGAARYLKGDHAAAIADYQKALSINPDDALAMHQLALVRAFCPDEHLRDLNRATVLAREAVQRLRVPTTLATLVAVYAETGNFEQAAAVQEERIAMVRSRGQTAALAGMQQRLAEYRQKMHPVPPAALMDAVKSAGKMVTRTRAETIPPKPRQGIRRRLSPFTVHVYSFQDREKANRIALKLRSDGNNAFACPVDLPEKGRWFRVYTGAFESKAKARKKAEALLEKGFPYGREVRRPWTVALRLPTGASSQNGMAAQLAAKGYLGYRLLSENGKARLVFGAFDTKQGAATALGELHRDGFGASVEKR
jgi:tetratricopeptide (TPR) repeat protein